MKRNAVVLVIIGFIGFGCVTANQYNSKTMQKKAQVSSKSGFVSEVDEPSSRGLLKKISSDECSVQERFMISPDNKHIIYAGTQGKISSRNAQARAIHLWKVPVAGGSAIKITSGGYEDCTYPCYTPDGKFIVFSSGGSLWKIQENGAGGRTRIPGSGLGTDFAPNISKEGKVVFCSYQQGGMQSGNYSDQRSFIWLCDINGGNLIQLREGLFPMWSPDSSKIVFCYDGDIWTLKEDGTELTQLSNTPDLYEGLPSFSNDGQKIIYVSNEGKNGKPMSDDYNIWEMKIDGSEKTQITELKSWDSWPLYGVDGIYFSSARAAKDNNTQQQRIWKLEQPKEENKQ